MKNETNTLDEMISALEVKRGLQLQVLKEQFNVACESVKPVNLIKNTLHEIAAIPDIKNNIVGSAMGMGIGFISKKLLMGSSRNPIKRVLGALIEFGVANIVAKHSESIKTTGGNLIQRFLKNRKAPKNDNDHDNEVLFI